MLTRRNSIIAIIVLMLIAVGLFLLRHYKKQDWQLVKQGPVVTAVYGLGTVQSDQVFNLKTGVAKYIKKMYVNEGDKVVEGEKLLQYNDDQIIRSPFSGIVTYRPTFTNEIPSPNTTILTITNLEKRYFLVSMDQDSLLNVKLGQKAVINFAALPKQKFDGEVKSIYSDGNNFYVRVDVKSLPQTVLRGMTADVAIITHSAKDSIQIPLAALKKDTVTYELDGIKKTVVVQIGAQAKGWGQVLSNNIPANAKVLIN
ncbi:MAG: HlyD family efflux transporter periplasmic adaptor subunit [Pseudomonadota bacterium]